MCFIYMSVLCDLPGDGRDRVDQRHHEAKEEGALPLDKFLLEDKNKGKK